MLRFRNARRSRFSASNIFALALALRLGLGGLEEKGWASWGGRLGWLGASWKAEPDDDENKAVRALDIRDARESKLKLTNKKRPLGTPKSPNSD